MYKPLFIVTIIILIVSSIIFIGRDDKIIGEVYGAEHEYMKIGEDTYTECDNPGVAISTARNKRLGKVVFRNTETDPMVVWSIKGYDNNEYIYALWVYDGAFYKKDSKPLSLTTESHLRSGEPAAPAVLKSYSMHQAVWRRK